MWNARVLVFVLCLVINVISGKIFETRCKLVRELLKIGMPNDMFLGQWVCLIEKVSKRDTSAFIAKPSGKKFYGLYQISNEWCKEKKRGGLCGITCEGVCLIEKVSKRDTSAFIAKPSGKKFYGLYQISNEWCKEKKRGGLCGITCEALLDEDIRDDTACALQIAKQHGFQSWTKWTTRCKNNNFITTEIYKCPDLMWATPERSLSSNSQYRRSPPRLRRSAYRPRRISKVTSFKRSRV